MRPVRVMLVAGESSGDVLAAELTGPLRAAIQERSARPTPDQQPVHASLQPEFFGAGGPRMAAAGIDLDFDLTALAVVGLVEVFQNGLAFRRLFLRLLQLAHDRQPDLIVLVDFSGFNRRLARALRRRLRKRRLFNNWQPKIVQYVSPQVWASRPRRALQMARDYDLLLSIFPFEQAWYAQHVPSLRVAFVGHPLVDRYRDLPAASRTTDPADPPGVLLLPGSRASELKRHLPVIVRAARILQRRQPVALRMVLPSQELVDLARPYARQLPEMELRIGGLAEVLAQSSLAIASTGTVTMECAYFGLPTVALYRTSWATYQIARRLIQVPCLAMPNILAGELVYPELIQQAARPEAIASAALQLLQDQPRRSQIQAKLARVVQSLGPPGASNRAAAEILSLLSEP